MEWSGLPPSRGQMEQASDANGAGFGRISARVEDWRQIRCCLVCAGAGARGECGIMLHSSISSIGEKKMESKQLNRQANSAGFEVEAIAPHGLGAI